MLKIANLLKKLLILVSIAKKNKMVGGSKSSVTNKNLFQSQ